MRKVIAENKRAKAIYHYFDSLFDFINYLDTTPTAKQFEGRSLSSHEGTEQFTGTKSYEEARSLCLEGYYKDDYKDFFGSVKLLESKIQETVLRKKQVTDILGYSPNVPAYLKGAPKNMYNEKKVEVPVEKKRIRIFYDVACTWTADQKEIMSKGICTLALVYNLELMGYDVELNLVDMAYSGNIEKINIFNVKKFGAEINYRALYFPLVHPSFLRRLCFRLAEVTEELPSSWLSGYGCAPGYNRGKEMLDLGPNDLFLPDVTTLPIHGRNLEEDYKKLCEYLKLQDLVDNKTDKR